MCNLVIRCTIAEPCFDILPLFFQVCRTFSENLCHTLFIRIWRRYARISKIVKRWSNKRIRKTNSNLQQ